MKPLYPALVLCTLIPALLAQQAHRAFPDDNLGYPVLITVGTSVGSGFYFNAGTAIYLVTAAHVLYSVPGAANGPRTLNGSRIDLLSYSGDIADTVPNRVRVDTAALGEQNIVRHATADIAVVRLFDIAGAGALRTLAGVTVQQGARAGILSANREAVARLNDVVVGNDVFLFGYPLSLNLALQIDPERPLLSKGIIAGVNRFSHSIILECPSYPGNSGGSVVEVDTIDALTRRFRIIGVVDQLIPFADASRGFGAANSGYSVIIPMDPALDLMNVP
ncbi:MAG TPA: trypsin-like peptidase domain-containing protein [Bryobacteraceae bacterium]|nr:trypsin-like peptidase domain-containing protein [Bryobacteraceae bacterium]